MTARRPRFSRTTPSPLSPTEHDQLIARHLAEHRLLRSTHLYRLLDRPADKVARRLAKLFHNGYLDRPKAQRDISNRGPNPPFVYALGPKAAHLFGEPDGIDWGAKNRTITHPYMQHTLEIADVMVAIECAVGARAQLRLLRSDEIAEDVRRTTGHATRSWTMTTILADLGIEIAAIPDKVFGLEHRETGRRNYFLLEVDRSTMPISRTSLEQSSFRKKLMAYHHGHAAKRHTTLWGIPGFRVLTVAISEERIASMMEALKDVTAGKGSNVFLFARLSDVLRLGPLSCLWITGKGNATSLSE